MQSVTVDRESRHKCQLSQPYCQVCWSNSYPSGSHLQHYHPFWVNCNSRPSVWLVSLSCCVSPPTVSVKGRGTRGQTAFRIPWQHPQVPKSSHRLKRLPISPVWGLGTSGLEGLVRFTRLAHRTFLEIARISIYQFVVLVLCCSPHVWKNHFFAWIR